MYQVDRILRIFDLFLFWPFLVTISPLFVLILTIHWPSLTFSNHILTMLTLFYWFCWPYFTEYKLFYYFQPILTPSLSKWFVNAPWCSELEPKDEFLAMFFPVFSLPRAGIYMKSVSISLWQMRDDDSRTLELRKYLRLRRNSLKKLGVIASII